MRRNEGGAVCTAPFLQRQTCCVLSGRFVRMPASDGSVRQIKQCRERIRYGTSHQGQDTGRSGCDISAIYVITGTRRRPGVLGGLCPLTRCVCTTNAYLAISSRCVFGYRRTRFQEKKHSVDIRKISVMSGKYPVNIRKISRRYPRNIRCVRKISVMSGKYPVNIREISVVSAEYPPCPENIP